MLPFPALSPWAERAEQGVSVWDQQGKGKQFDQGPWSQAHGGLVWWGFSACISVKLILFLEK